MEHREFTRVRTVLPVDLLCEGAAPAIGTTRDLSLNGCLVATNSDLAEGAACTAILLIDGRDGAIRATAHARVVRRLPAGLALRFDELVELDSYEHLRNLILYNAEDPNRAECEFDSHLGLRRVDPAAPPPG